jgi:hypothetical protein
LGVRAYLAARAAREFRARVECLADVLEFAAQQQSRDRVSEPTFTSGLAPTFAATCRCSATSASGPTADASRTAGIRLTANLGRWIQAASVGFA